MAPRYLESFILDGVPGAVVCANRWCMLQQVLTQLQIDSLDAAYCAFGD